MTKKLSKKVVSILLALLMLISTAVVFAEDDGYTYPAVSAEAETLLRPWTSAYTCEMYGASTASGQPCGTCVGFNGGNYVVFRGDFAETAIYEMDIVWGTKNPASPKFAVSIDDAEAVTVQPQYSGLGTFTPDYQKALTVPFTAGKHKIKVELVSGSGYLIGVNLRPVAEKIALESFSADGVEEITDASPYVSADTKNLVLKLTTAVDPETVNDENIILTTAGGEEVTIDPTSDGNIIYIPVEGMLAAGQTYTLIVDGVKDIYNYFNLDEIFTNFEVKEKTFTYFDVAESGTTEIRATNLDVADRGKPDGTAMNTGNGFISFQPSYTLTFRANVKTAGVYELFLGIGSAAEEVKNYTVTVDSNEAQTVSAVGGLGWFTSNYNSVLNLPLTEGKHVIKVKSVNASLYFRGIKLGLIEKQIELESLSADGIEEITDANPYVSADTKNLVLKLTSAVNPETVNSENIILTTDGGEVITIAPEADENTIYIPVAGELVAGKTYTLIVEGVKDSYNCFDLAEIFTNFEVKEKTYTYFTLAESGETTIAAKKVDQADRLKPDGTPMNFEYSAISYQNNFEVTYRVYNETMGIYDLFIGLGYKDPRTYTLAVTVDDGAPENVTVQIAGGTGNQSAEYVFAKALTLEPGKHTIKVKSVGASTYLHGIKLDVIAKGILFANAKADGAQITEEMPFVSVDTKNLTVELSELIDAETVTAETVKLTYGEGETVTINPIADGKVITIPVSGKLQAGMLYTLTLEGIKDSYNASTLTMTEVQFTTYSGSYSNIKYEDFVFEAETFTEAGIYSGGDKADASLVETGTTADGVTYVELNNLEYIKVPLPYTATTYYRIYVVYATDKTPSVSVASKYQETFASTGDLETFKEHSPKTSALLYTAYPTVGYIRPQNLGTDGKIRIDKIILRRGMVVPEDGTVAVRSISNNRDDGISPFPSVGSVGTPAFLEKEGWAEYVMYFPANGYYNVRARASVTAGYTLDLTLSSDEKVFAEKSLLLNDSKVLEYGLANAVDFGTYYFDKGYHVIKLEKTGSNYTYAYELLWQKTDLLDGESVSALDATAYSEGITLDTTTQVEAGQFITSTVEAKEDGYYSIYAMISSASAKQNITATVDNTEYTVALKKTADFRTIQNTKIAEVYLTKGTHTVKLAVPEEGSAIGVFETTLYAPQIEAEGVPVNVAAVRLNGLFEGKPVNAALAVYKEKDGVKQLADVDYVSVDKAATGTEFDLSATDVIFEEGYTYSAKVFVLNNMAGVVKEYTEE